MGSGHRYYAWPHIRGAGSIPAHSPFRSRRRVGISHCISNWSTVAPGDGTTHLSRERPFNSISSTGTSSYAIWHGYKVLDLPRGNARSSVYLLAEPEPCTKPIAPRLFTCNCLFRSFNTVKRLGGHNRGLYGINERAAIERLVRDWYQL